MTRNTLISLAALAALAGCSEAEPSALTEVELDPATATESSVDDAVRVELDRSATLENAANVNTEAVTYTWALEENLNIAVAPEPHRDVSRQYRVYVDGEQLAAGVELPITQERALVAVTPLTPEPLVANPRIRESVTLDSPVGRFAEGAGVTALAGGQELSAAGDFEMNPNMVAFTTAPQVGTGPVTLRLADVNPDALAVIQVVERDSPIALEFAANRTSYFGGDTFEFDAEWIGDLSAVEYRWARLRTPNGNVVDVELDDTGAPQLHGTGQVPELDLRPGELVELEIDAIGTTAEGARVQRTAKTAFAIARRTAALGEATLRQTDEGVVVPVEVEVGSRGRFAVTGTLYATNAAGEQVPFLGCQTAAMLEPGSQTLTLRFGAEDLESSELGAPFEIRDLRLQDQSRMYVLR